MADAFVGAVVHVDGVGLPAFRQAGVVHREAVVLRSDEALVRARLAHRLVVGAVAVFQFIDGGAGGFAEQLVAHADAADGLAAERDLLADDVDGSLTGVGVAGTIGQEETVEVHRSVVVIPGNADNLNTTIDKTTYDIILYTTIYKNNLTASTFIIADYIFARYFIYPVNALILGSWNILWFIVE